MIVSQRYQEQKQTNSCVHWQICGTTLHAWHQAVVCLQVVFWGTLAVMVVCYTFISKKVYESYRSSKSKSKAASRRTKAKVFVVVGVFFVCFAPFHFARIPYTLTQTGDMTSTCRAENALYITKETTLWLSATNVCLDPLIYVFLCRVFRKRLTAAICRRHPGTVDSATATSTQMEMSQIAQSYRLSNIESTSPMAAEPCWLVWASQVGG